VAGPGARPWRSYRDALTGLTLFEDLQALRELVEAHVCIVADLPTEFVPQHLTAYGGLELLRRYCHLLGLHRRIRHA
jgi:hypothetical protein